MLGNGSPSWQQVCSQHHGCCACLYCACCKRVCCVAWLLRLQDIQQRAANKEHMLALINAERKATNDRKRIERELFDSLRRDKVDSIQKMQVSRLAAANRVQGNMGLKSGL